jgi:NAD(P)-dependent dehydrogenase (short-subunit alcohol dehydrogenase family)
MTENVPTYPDLQGKVALVTGGSGGIGAATCRLLAANGARVAVNGRDEDRIGATVEAIRAEGGEAVGAPADCTVLVERTRRVIPEERRLQMAAEIPLGRLGTPEDVALAALFLASESSSWITGVTLDVAGGWIMD